MTIFQFFLQTKIEQLPIINTSAICEKQWQRQRRAFFRLKSRAKQKRLQSLKWFISSKVLCNEDCYDPQLSFGARLTLSLFFSLFSNSSLSSFPPPSLSNFPPLSFLLSFFLFSVLFGSRFMNDPPATKKDLSLLCFVSFPPFFSAVTNHLIFCLLIQINHSLQFLSVVFFLSLSLCYEPCSVVFYSI